MSEKQHATWGGRFTEGPSDLMLRFSESVSFDQRLALFDIEGSRAHASMLQHVGLISGDEYAAISKGLEGIEIEIKEGRFTWKLDLEDVHMNIEQALTERVPAAAKLHTARSRNDQIATDMRLYFKQACRDIEDALKKLLIVLLGKAEQFQSILIPGYTHLQRAQPVSAAHHILAWVEMFGRDLGRFGEVSEKANVCPLGSGALAGTTLPIDRNYTALQLGFVDQYGNARVTANSMDSVADRDVFIEFLTACALAASHMSRIAEDIILWNSTEFSFVSLPAAFTTGSSLMPQKKNPDSLELIRGKAARLQSHVQTLFTLVKGLPLTYNRDLQEDKPPVFDAYDQLMLMLSVLEQTTDGMIMNPSRCSEAVADPLLLATDLADYLVEKGVPFREAHHLVGELVALAEKENIALPEIDKAKAGTMHSALEGDWKSVFNLEKAMLKRNKPGMPGPDAVLNEIEKWRKKLATQTRP